MSGTLCNGECKCCLRRPFLPAVHILFENLGIEMIPRDIDKSTNDFQLGIEEHIIVWFEFGTS